MRRKRKRNPHLSHRLDFVGFIYKELADEAKEYLEGRGFTVTLTSIPSSHTLPAGVQKGDRELYVLKGKGKAAQAAMKRLFSA